MKHLILYGYSGLDAQMSNDLLEFTTGFEDCQVVLIQDGVLNMAKSPEYKKLIENGKNLFYVVEDFEARGLPSLAQNQSIAPISYNDLIDKIEMAEQVISWL